MKHTNEQLLADTLRTPSELMLQEFLAKIEPVLRQLITHNLSKSNSTDLNARANNLFGASSDPEDKKYSQQFLVMLQECYKFWGSGIDESLPSASKITEIFYELLDKGAIEFTEETKLFGRDILKIGILDNDSKADAVPQQASHRQSQKRD